PAPMGGSVPPPRLNPLGGPLGGPAPMGNPLGGPSPLSGPPRGSVPPPAFPQPRPQAAAPMPMAQPSAAPAARPGAGNPFEIAAPSAAMVEKKVRLVIDDSAVKEDEIGRKSNTRNVVLVVIGTVLGLAVGLGIASTFAERKQFSMAVHDGKDIYARV